MRPISQRVSALGVGPWIPVNRLQNAFGMGIEVIPTGTNTSAVQFTMDPLDDDQKQVISISRTTTTATVTHTNHGMASNDSAIITGSGASNLDKPDGVTITVVDANTYTYTVANSGPTADTGFAKAKVLRVQTHATLTALSARANGNFAYPITAVRGAITAYTNGFVDFCFLQGLGR